MNSSKYNRCRACAHCTRCVDFAYRQDDYICQITKEGMCKDDLYAPIKCTNFLPNSEKYILDEYDYYYRYKE